MKRFLVSSTIGASLLGLLAVTRWRAAVSKRIVDGAARAFLWLVGRLVSFEDGRMVAYQNDALNLSVSPKVGEPPIAQTIVFNGLDSLLTAFIWRADTKPLLSPDEAPPAEPDTPPDDPTDDPPNHDSDFWRGKLD